MPENSEDDIFSVSFSPVIWIEWGLWGLWGKTNITSLDKLQKLQNRTEKNSKILCHFYKELKNLKFLDCLFLQNCLFMSPTETNKKVTSSFVELNIVETTTTIKLNPKQKDFLIYLFLTQIYGTQSTKCNCIKDWKNFRNNFPNIPLH